MVMVVGLQLQSKFSLLLNNRKIVKNLTSIVIFTMIIFGYHLSLKTNRQKFFFHDHWILVVFAH
jgi:hypothetical protein